MTPAPCMPRPAGSPAYYLGRPASWWIAATRQRSTLARHRRAAAATARQEAGLPVPGIPVADPGEAFRQATGVGLVVHRADPLNAETPLPLLAGVAVVPSDQFYVRNHFGIPHLDPASWRLEVSGLVGQRLSLSLAELQAMPSRTAVVTLECAGNGRSGLDRPALGEQWGLGAVGTAAWTGVPLTEVLDLAAPQPGAREVVFRGADSGRTEGRDGVLYFERSLTLRHLGSAGALLAYGMNGQALPRLHGYPLRLIVPGWYGVASVKWLAGIELTSQAFDGHFQVDRYRIDGQPVTLQAVRSVITDPHPGETLGPGDVTVRGLAWSGAAPIAGVEVRSGGRPWQAAMVTGTRHPHSWQSWRLRARVEESGRLIVRARATDTAGRGQPGRAAWNPLGYSANPVHQVVVTVRSATDEPGASTNPPGDDVSERAPARRKRCRTPGNRRRADSAHGSQEKRATAALRPGARRGHIPPGPRRPGGEPG